MCNANRVLARNGSTIGSGSKERLQQARGEDPKFFPCNDSGGRDGHCEGFEVGGAVQCLHLAGRAVVLELEGDRYGHKLDRWQMHQLEGGGVAFKSANRTGWVWRVCEAWGAMGEM